MTNVSVVLKVYVHRIFFAELGHKARVLGTFAIEHVLVLVPGHHGLEQRAQKTTEVVRFVLGQR